MPSNKTSGIVNTLEAMSNGATLQMTKEAKGSRSAQYALDGEEPVHGQTINALIANGYVKSGRGGSCVISAAGRKYLASLAQPA